MSVYQAFEAVVIALIVAASANRVLRQYAPASHRSARVWLAARLGIKLASAPTAAQGCGTGCGTCSTGCASPAPGNSEKEKLPVQPIHFHPRKG